MKKLIILVGLFSLLLFVPACNKLENETRSNSLLLVTSIKGHNWEDKDADVLISDVIVETSKGSYVQSDSALVEFKAELLNPSVPPGESTVYNDIIVERYVVTFSRVEGYNTPGVDVPYPIEGNMSLYVPIGGTAKVYFVIVTINAKCEPPLINLRDGGEPEIKATATIDFYGHDVAGNKVTAKGYLSTFFGNYMNEEEEPTPPSSQKTK